MDPASSNPIGSSTRPHGPIRGSWRPIDRPRHIAIGARARRGFAGRVSRVVRLARAGGSMSHRIDLRTQSHAPLEWLSRVLGRHVETARRRATLRRRSAKPAPVRLRLMEQAGFRMVTQRRCCEQIDPPRRTGAVVVTTFGRGPALFGLLRHQRRSSRAYPARRRGRLLPCGPPILRRWRWPISAAWAPSAPTSAGSRDPPPWRACRRRNRCPHIRSRRTEFRRAGRSNSCGCWSGGSAPVRPASTAACCRTYSSRCSGRRAGPGRTLHDAPWSLLDRHYAR